MFNKWALAFILIGVIGLWMTYSKLTYTNQSQVADNDVNSMKKNDKDTPQNAANSIPNQELTTQPNEYTEQQQNILIEIEQRIFSTDPYVELASLMIQLSLCREEFEYMDLFGSNTVYHQQKELNESLRQTCNHYRKQYPNILSMNQKQMRQVFTPTSQLGRLLKAQEEQGLTPIERQENAELTLFYALKEKNASLVLISAFMHRFSSGNHDALKSILGSNDVNYTGQMSQLALGLMSCNYQNGQSCTSTSIMMVMACSQNPEACGLSFQDWYAQNTLPGMKRDVEKAMVYYQRMVP